MSDEFVVSVTLPGTPEHFTRACTGAVVVGRAPECDLQLVHPLVSRRHAEMSLTEDGRFLVRDLESSNGTVVNDELLVDAERSVDSPAVVQVGPYLLQLTLASALAEQTIKATPARETTRLSLDRGQHILLVDGKPAVEGLVGLEYRLLDALTAASGRVVPNRGIGDGLWGADAWDAYMLHNLVRRVRRKLEDKGLEAERLIVSLPGDGYYVA